MLLERNNNNYNNTNQTFRSNNFNGSYNQSFNYNNQRFQNNNYNNQNMPRSKSMINSFRNRNNIINTPNPNYNYIRNQRSYNPNLEISNNENYNNNYENEEMSNLNEENYTNNLNYENFQNQNQKSFNGYNKQNMEVNRDMNNYFRSLLKSRGVHFSRGNTYQDIKQEENNRKKVYMENIQNQISLLKKSKLDELKKRENEDKQYLKDMINSYPFGRGGAGAPIRDKNGNVVAALRNLVTDPKYNLVQINVDDDYYDVWDKDKRYGLVNFRNKGYDGFVNNLSKSMNFNRVNNNRSDYFSQNLNQNNINRSLSTNQNKSFFNTINGNLNNNLNSNFNSNFNQDNMNYNFSFNNNNRRFVDAENNNNFNDMNNINYNNENNQINNLNVINEIPNKENQLYENSNIRNADLNISYDNYELTNETKRTTQQLYSDFLQNQIREKEKKKYLEKLKKEEEDRKEEEKLRRENEELKKRAEEERNLTKVKTTTTTTINKEEKKEEKKEEEIDYELEYLKKLDMESRLHLNNELSKLRDAIQEQELGLTKEIKLIQQETENANKDRNEALKKIEGLKNDLSVQRMEDEIRRKHVYDIIINENYPVYDFNDRNMDFYNNKDNLITKKLNEKFEGGFKTHSKLQTFGNYFDNDDYKFKYDISDEDYFLNDIKNKLGDKNSNMNNCDNLDIEEIEEEKAKMNNIYNKNMDRLRKIQDYEKGKSNILDKDLDNYNIIEFNEDDYN